LLISEPLASARKAINDYKKATGKEAGVFELMMVYAECGVHFIVESSCDKRAYYNSIQKMLVQVFDILKHDQQCAKQYQARTNKLIATAGKYMDIQHWLDTSS